MKKIAKFILLSAVIFLASSCAREQFSSLQDNSLKFRATIANATRTAIAADGTAGKVSWAEGDEVNINGIVYVATLDENDLTTVTLVKKDAADPDPEAYEGMYYATYACSYDPEIGVGMLPPSQYTTNASQMSAPMFAASSTTDLSFKNIEGLLEITLKGDAVVKSIQVSSDNLGMAGRYTIEDGQTAKVIDESNKGVTLTSIGGKALTEEGIRFYLAIPAGAYEGLTITVTNALGTVWTKTSVNTATVEANKIYPLTFTPEFVDSYVAQIGDVKYGSLSAAFEAVGSEPVTITLLDKCNNKSKIETAAGTDITLDLNGQTVDAYISTYGKVTVVDNSEKKSGVLRTASGWAQSFYVRDGGELVVESGTVTGPADDAAIKCSAGGLVTVNGGTIKGYEAVYFSSANSEVIVNDGYLSATEGIFDLYAAGKLTINGGYFNGNLVCGNKKTANTITLGGYYTSEPNFASTGYAGIPLALPVTKNGLTYIYSIIEYKVMLSVNGVEYEDVAEAVEAIAAASSDVTVKVLQNISLEQEITINSRHKVTFDLNGKTVRAQNASGVSAVVVEGASTVVDIIDSVGGGMLDHTYSNTGYTLTVKSGTVNLISGNISNMTSTGYGRVAVRVLATGAPAYFNMTGGVVRGGRAIRLGGASEDARAYVTVSGGLVEGRNTDTGNYYTAISLETGYSTLLINGGTIKGAATKSVVYSTTSCTNSMITITKNEATGTIPFIYAGGKYCVASGSSAFGNEVYNKTAWNFYTNVSATSYCGSPVPKKTELSSPVTDEYGNTYTYHLTAAN